MPVGAPFRAWWTGAKVDIPPNYQPRTGNAGNTEADAEVDSVDEFMEKASKIASAGYLGYAQRRFANLREEFAKLDADNRKGFNRLFALTSVGMVGAYLQQVDANLKAGQGDLIPTQTQIWDGGQAAFVRDYLATKAEKYGLGMSAWQVEQESSLLHLTESDLQAMAFLLQKGEIENSLIRQTVETILAFERGFIGVTDSGGLWAGRRVTNLSLEKIGIDVAWEVSDETWARLGGVQRAAAGVAEVGLGWWTGLGAVHGADQIWTGLSQAFSGKPQKSFTQQGLEALGMTPEKAALGDAVIGFVLTVGADFGARAVAVRAGAGAGRAMTGAQVFRATVRSMAPEMAGMGIGASVGFARTGTLQGTIEGAFVGYAAVGGGRFALGIGKGAARLGYKGAQYVGNTRAFQAIKGEVTAFGRQAMGRFIDRFAMQVCFPPDTLVGTETGMRPIREIEAGERVWSYDFAGGSWHLCMVERRHDSHYDTLVTMDLGDGEVTATAHHPFWVIEGEDLEDRGPLRHVDRNDDRGLTLPGRWVNSHELREGDVVFLRDRGRAVIQRVYVREEPSPVCNLTVQDLHTFAVGEMQVLVHNASGTMPGASQQGAALRVKEPRILSNKSLSQSDQALAMKHFGIKRRAIERAAKRGELEWSPGTDNVRIEGLQAAHRTRVAQRYESMFGKPLDMSRLNADHPVDLLIGGSANQRLRMLNESVNKSIGAALLRAGTKAGLKAGQKISEVIFFPRLGM